MSPTFALLLVRLGILHISYIVEAMCTHHVGRSGCLCLSSVLMKFSIYNDLFIYVVSTGEEFIGNLRKD